MNSLYGKCIEKIHDKRDYIFHERSKLVNFMKIHWNEINNTVGLQKFNDG